MAWKLSKDGALQSAWDSSLCMQVVGGGSLVACDGSRGQQWTMEGAEGRQKLISGTGFGCLSNGPPAGGPPTRLAFDVTALGWKKANATDLWSGESTVVTTAAASLPQGDGISQIFRLQKLS